MDSKDEKFRKCILVKQLFPLEKTIRKCNKVRGNQDLELIKIIEGNICYRVFCDDDNL